MLNIEINTPVSYLLVHVYCFQTQLKLFQIVVLMKSYLTNEVLFTFSLCQHIYHNLTWIIQSNYNTNSKIKT